MSGGASKKGRGWEPVELRGDVAPPAGAYTPVARAGSLLFVSGQVPTDAATGRVVGEDVGTQTKFVIEKLGRLLESAGSSLDRVVSVTAYLSNIDDWAAFNDAYRACFQAPYPTRTTLGAGLHGFLVEISAIAVAAKASG